MVEIADNYDIKEIAATLDYEIQKLPVKNVPDLRAIRRRYSQNLKYAEPQFIIDLAMEIFNNYGYRWIAYELIKNHKEAIRKIGEAELMKLGRDIDSWGAVDSFACYLSGNAWQKGQISDQLIHKWARSKDRWWRRVALVSTVPLNKRSHGGKGDIPRTLEVCKILVNDHDDMVEKAMSWALRELIIHDADEVRRFLVRYDNVLASRVKREVNNKLATGLKNPKKTNK